ncbi:MAG: hypothetical protein WBL99_12575 [Candidatus Acidiferrales bacterium]
MEHKHEWRVEPENLSNTKDDKWSDRIHWTDHIHRKEYPAIAAEPKIFAALVSAKTIRQISDACRASRLLRQGGLLGKFGNALQREPFANGLLAAKKYRFPKSDRKTSKPKQLIHIARAMAGIESGDRPATSIQRFRLLKHDEECRCAPCCFERLGKVERVAEEELRKITQKYETKPPLGVFFVVP